MHAKNMKHPYLLLLAGSDKIVDNDGAYQFHEKTSTQASSKELADIKDCYHILWKDPEYAVPIYEATYKYISKMLNQQSKPWPGITTWNAGPPKKRVESKLKRMIFLCFVFWYLSVGLVLFILTKIFTK